MPLPVDDAIRRAAPARLALCLSGGGWRAAIFHLGALWRLHELGELARVERVSSVSGGSIVAGWWALRLVEDGADAGETAYRRWCAQLDLRSFVEGFRAIAATDVRTRAVLATFLPNLVWHRFGAKHLERAYRRLLGDRPLADLPRAPSFVFCATDLTFGVNFEFSRERVGDYRAGYLRADGADGERPEQIPVARAIAASSCFPPVFGPLRLDVRGMHFTHGAYDGPDRDHLRERIDLTDGGVYDNLAMEPVIKRAERLYVSDGGAPFPFRPGGHVFRRLMRYTAVIGNQAVALRKRLFHALDAQREPGSAVWSLVRPVRGARHGYSAELIASALGRIRTDLDRFDDAEFEILVNHGYGSCADALEAGGRPGPAPEWPYPRWADESAVEVALARSHRRLDLRRLSHSRLL